MPSVWKDIFRPGTYRGSDGTKHTFTSRDVIEAYQNGRAQLRDATPYSAPLIWEHDWTAAPEPITHFLSVVGPDRDKRADHVRNTFGWVEDYELRFEGDKPVLWAKATAPDQADLDQWQKARFCSPRVDYDLNDSMRRTWKGCSIAHVAAVNNPVQKDQKPIMLGAGASSRTVFLGEIMAEETDDKGKKKTEGGDGGKDGAGTNNDLTRLKTVMAKLGFPIPDSVTDMDGAFIALETHAANEEQEDEVSLDDPDADDTGDSQTTAAGLTPAMLSALPAEAQNAIKYAENAKKQAVDIHRNDLLKRLKAVEKPAVERGLYSPTEMKSLERRLTGVNLSFDGEGKLVKNGAIQELVVLERAVKGTGGKTPAGKKPAKTAAVNLGAYGFGTTPAEAQPGTPEFDELVKKEAKRVGDLAVGAGK